MLQTNHITYNDFHRKCFALSQLLNESHEKMDKLENDVFMFVNRPLQLEKDVAIYEPSYGKIYRPNGRQELTHSHVYQTQRKKSSNKNNPKAFCPV